MNSFLLFALFVFCFAFLLFASVVTGVTGSLAGVGVARGTRHLERKQWKQRERTGRVQKSVARGAGLSGRQQEAKWEEARWRGDGKRLPADWSCSELL